MEIQQLKLFLNFLCLQKFGCKFQAPTLHYNVHVPLHPQATKSTWQLTI